MTQLSGGRNGYWTVSVSTSTGQRPTRSWYLGEHCRLLVAVVGLKGNAPIRCEPSQVFLKRVDARCAADAAPINRRADLRPQLTIAPATSQTRLLIRGAAPPTRWVGSCGGVWRTAFSPLFGQGASVSSEHVCRHALGKSPTSSPWGSPAEPCFHFGHQWTAPVEKETVMVCCCCLSKRSLAAPSSLCWPTQAVFTMDFSSTFAARLLFIALQYVWLYPVTAVDFQVSAVRLYTSVCKWRIAGLEDFLVFNNSASLYWLSERNFRRGARTGSSLVENIRQPAPVPLFYSQSKTGSPVTGHVSLFPLRSPTLFEGQNIWHCTPPPPPPCHDHRIAGNQLSRRTAASFLSLQSNAALAFQVNRAEHQTEVHIISTQWTH